MSWSKMSLLHLNDENVLQMYRGLICKNINFLNLKLGCMLSVDPPPPDCMYFMEAP